MKYFKIADYYVIQFAYDKFRTFDKRYINNYSDNLPEGAVEISLEELPSKLQHRVNNPFFEIDELRNYQIEMYRRKQWQDLMMRASTFNSIPVTVTVKRPNT